MNILKIKYLLNFYLKSFFFQNLLIQDSKKKTYKNCEINVFSIVQFLNIKYMYK